ncbi:hypothetical protein ACO0LF_16790 [Undibacterium sp. Di27W]|uniref:hypothetical protein n=1 Tax=Undibacterium sp. Di27W TaxID=3413036 RepID=UPI003BF2F3D2
MSDEEEQAFIIAIIAGNLLAARGLGKNEKVSGILFMTLPAYHGYIPQSAVTLER